MARVRAGADALLTGIRVVDLSTPLGEMAGRVLADLGAEVFKVEPPGGAGLRQQALQWAAWTQGKKSVVLDIESAADHGALLDLVAGADILIESWRPGEAERRGLGYPLLARRNPSLIYLSISPFGQDGPRALRPAGDLTLQASGGLMSFVGEGDRPPLYVPGLQSFCHAGVQAAADALIALCERDRSGLGQHLDVSVQAAMVWTLLSGTGWPLAIGRDQPGAGADRAQLRKEVRPGVPAERIVRCRDGYVLPAIVGTAATTGGTNSTLAVLVRWGHEQGQVSAAVAATDWRNWEQGIDEGRLSAAEVRVAIGEVHAFLRTLTKREFLEYAEAKGLPMAPVLGVDDLVSDRQLAGRDYWQEIEGRRHPGPFARFSRTPIRLDKSPVLGEHQDELPRLAARPLMPAATGRGAALQGLKVADFTWAGVGPLTTKALADHGATVVHVESAKRIDTLRRAGAPWQGKPGIERSHFFSNYNTSKLGLALNLAVPAGVETARRLIGWADVVIDSFTPGTMSRLGLDYGELRRSNPALISASASLRGGTGAGAAFRGYGSAGAALSGLHALTGWPDRAPCGPGVAYTDTIAPRFLVAAIAAAVHERSRSGEGQHIDLSQIEASIHFIGPMVLDYTMNGRVAAAQGNSSAFASPHGVYRTRGEERYLALAVESPAQWQALCSVIDMGEFAGQDHASLEARRRAAAPIEARLAAWALEQEPFPAEQMLVQNGVPAAVVLRPSDLYRDPQLLHRGFFVEVEHPVMGKLLHDGFATRFSVTPPQLRSAGPCLGQHTDQVLAEFLNLSPDEIAALKAAGALE